MDDPSSQKSAPLEGLHFNIADLQMAMAWVADRPSVRLLVMTDHRYVPEALEIYPPGSKTPRWCLWRDYEGRLHVDDWVRSEFDLPYLNLVEALGFITSHL